MSAPADYPEVRIEQAAPVGVGRVCVSWSIDRSRSVAEPGPFELRWTLSASGPSEAELIGSTGRAHRLRLVEEQSSFRFDEKRSMLHVDLPGHCSISIDVSGGRARLLYARTTVMEELGVPGGCAEIASFKTG